MIDWLLKEGGDVYNSKSFIHKLKHNISFQEVIHSIIKSDEGVSL